MYKRTPYSISLMMADSERRFIYWIIEFYNWLYTNQWHSNHKDLCKEFV